MTPTKTPAARQTRPARGTKAAPAGARAPSAEDKAAARSERWRLQREAQTLNWEKMLRELKEYRQKHGHLLVTTADPKLYGWIVFQRANRKNLSEKQTRQLDKAGFPWHLKDARWGRFIVDMRGYVGTHGSIAGLENNAPNLADLAYHYRDELRAGKLSEKQAAEYYETTAALSLFEQTRAAAVEKLRAFSEEHGHFDFQAVRTEQAQALGALAAMVRHRRNARILSAEFATALDDSLSKPVGKASKRAKSAAEPAEEFAVDSGLHRRAMKSLKQAAAAGLTWGQVIEAAAPRRAPRPKG